ncbi:MULTISPECIES: hypothetical protein [Salipiger]|uniref:hypothetical protein n=2 Tax=Roseobacteraceae TaxID=2854170 RepID=UPI003519C5A6
MSPTASPHLSRRGFLAGASAAALAAGLPRPALAQSVPLSAFSTPAFIQDLAANPTLQAALNEAWNINANGWTEQAIRGNPFTTLFAANQDYYYNPLSTDLTGSIVEKVSWTAFPNRAVFYLDALSDQQRFEFVDFGYSTSAPIAPIPATATICAEQTGGEIPANGPTNQFQPYGPRGWMDEYCEMAVTREGDRTDGRITRIDFVCENPEYWYTLWSVSPETVLEIYQEILGRPQITLADLELHDAAGNPVIDPGTGRPAYNPLNKWNSGPHRTADGGGAMHLTSTPNTLQTELGLAGAATVLRNMGNANGTDLICCAQYGQIMRNSDPHIGQISNQIVGFGGGFRVSLADPIGLYIQTPTFTNYVLPDDPNLPEGARAADCWTILRGQETLPGFPSNFNFLLHVKFEIPQAWRDAGVSFEVGDIAVDGEPIRYGSQMLPTIQVALFPRAVAADTPQAPQPCVAGLSAPFAKAQPQQIMYQDLWDGYNATAVPNARGVAMTLASNTIIVAPRIVPGTTATLALLGSAFEAAGALPQVAFFREGDTSPDAAITVTVEGLEDVVYAVPGNSEPGPQQLLRLTVDVGADAAPGTRSVSVANAGDALGETAPFFLWVEG